MSYQRLCRREINQRDTLPTLVLRARQLLSDYAHDDPFTLATIVRVARPLTQHPKPCTIVGMANMHRRPAVEIRDFRNLESLSRAARSEQKRLAAALPEPLRSTPRWKLVQDKHLPSLAELRDRLLTEGLTL